MSGRTAVPRIWVNTCDTQESRIFGENPDILKFAYFENYWELEVVFDTLDLLGLVFQVLELPFGARVLRHLHVSGGTLAHLTNDQCCALDTLELIVQR